MSISPEDQRYLEHVLGYEELGMFEAALEAFQRISSENRKRPKFLSLQMNLLIQMKEWSKAIEVGQRLFQVKRIEAAWYIQYAYALRRAKSIEAARKVLLQGEKEYPNDATLQFNLGCYAVQLADYSQAFCYLERAFKLEPEFKKLAEEDPDLEPIRDKLRELLTHCS